RRHLVVVPVATRAALRRTRVVLRPGRAPARAGVLADALVDVDLTVGLHDDPVLHVVPHPAGDDEPAGLLAPEHTRLALAHLAALDLHAGLTGRRHPGACGTDDEAVGRRQLGVPVHHDAVARTTGDLAPSHLQQPVRRGHHGVVLGSGDHALGHVHRRA